MSRRTLKSINWSAIAERLPESEKNIFAAFKSRSDQYLRKVSELPDAPLKIDWSMYKKQVAIPGMVDKFQKEYESLSVPYPADNYTAKLEEQEKVTLAGVEQFKQESNKRIVEFQAEAQKLKDLLPFDQMTLEDFAEAFPEKAINIDKPTMWPHIPEEQPADREVSEPMPKEQH